MLMAGLDGVLNRIEPGDPLDKDIYDLSPEEMKSVPSMPASLEEALACLEDDHQFLLKGDVFTEELIETFIEYKRRNEADAIRLRPHPYEFSLVLRHLDFSSCWWPPRLCRRRSTRAMSRSSATTGASLTSHGKTDADAVFGMVYAQAEDDFNRVETNYLNSMGRLAEAEGESKIYQDLRMKLFIDPVELKKQYAASPAWLQTLMNAFADGLNYLSCEHPEVKPRVIKHFEPWMALSFTEGSIGGDIETRQSGATGVFYGNVRGERRQPGAQEESSRNPRDRTAWPSRPRIPSDHHALLLINPHTSFFFRSELQMVSDQGLNAYGAVTWGQFFIYQGFNDRAGWMHTSSGVDAVDEYLETVTKRAIATFTNTGTKSARLTRRKSSCLTKRPGNGGKEVHRLPHAARTRSSARSTGSGSPSV